MWILLVVGSGYVCLVVLLLGFIGALEGGRRFGAVEDGLGRFLTRGTQCMAGTYLLIHFDTALSSFHPTTLM